MLAAMNILLGWEVIGRFVLLLEATDIFQRITH